MRLKPFHFGSSSSGALTPQVIVFRHLPQFNEMCVRLKDGLVPHNLPAMSDGCVSDECTKFEMSMK